MNVQNDSARPQAAFDVVGVATAPDDLQLALSARALTLFVGAIGLMLTAAALGETLIAATGHVGRQRLTFGLMLIAMAVICRRVATTGRPRLANAVLLFAGMLATSLYAWQIGLGTAQSLNG